MYADDTTIYDIWCIIATFTILQRTSTEVNVYIWRHETRSFCTHYVGNVIYNKVLPDDVFYRINRENVNVMLE